jgi:hypothetical protein
MTIAREEIFGPVMSIMKFKTEEEVCTSSYYDLPHGYLIRGRLFIEFRCFFVPTAVSMDLLQVFGPGAWILPTDFLEI